ncbi:MAG: hypothetical protein JWO58_3034 [Chitinophagaceae bacterium]|nr:hypothetical protein [Chitinophagaceae bacterium]
MKKITLLLIACAFGLFQIQLSKAQLTGATLNLYGSGGPLINFLSSSSGPLRSSIFSNTSSDLVMSSFGNFTFNNPSGSSTYLNILTASNYVGVGLANPTAPFQIANALGSTTKKLVLFDDKVGVGTDLHNFYGFGVNSSNMRYQTSYANTNHIFYAGNGATPGTSTGSNELMRITGSGALVVGGTSSSGSIQLTGTANPTSQLSIYGTAPGITLYGSGYSKIYNNNSSVGFGLPTSQWNDLIVTNLGDIVFGNATSPSFTEKVRLTTAGNFGIATTSPQSKLHVNDVVQVTGSTTPSNTKAGLTAGENSTYTWLQSNTAKPLALNPTPSSTQYVAIGFTPGAYTVPSGYSLAVKGNIIAEGLLVKLVGSWPDFVFDKNYKLMPLNNLETYIAANKHLPEIPSASEMEKEGVNTAEMDKMLLQKIEELTLYVIQQQKEIEALKQVSSAATK